MTSNNKSEVLSVTPVATQDGVTTISVRVKIDFDEEVIPHDSEISQRSLLNGLLRPRRLEPGDLVRGNIAPHEPKVGRVLKQGNDNLVAWETRTGQVMLVDRHKLQGLEEE